MKNVCSISVKNFCFLFLFAMFNLQAQETDQSYAVKGTVLEQGSMPLGGVNVVLKGTKEGVVTDMDGKFEFTQKLEADDVLVFSYIGYNPQEYTVVADESENQSIEITFDLSNISLMGAVEVDGVYKSKRNIFQKLVGLFK